MKLKFLFAAAAALMSVACSEPVGMESVQKNELVELEISVDGMQTKAASAAGETTVKDVQVFIFGKTSKQLESYGSAASGSVKLSATPGEKTICTLVNAPAISDVNNYDAFSQKVSFLKDNASGGFVMEGIRSKKLASAKDTAKVKVDRLVSKVTLASVANQLEAPYSELSFSVNKVYLINVLGEARYFGDVTGLTGKETWHNKKTYSAEASTSIPALTYEAFSTPVSVENAKSYTTPHYFYCYPNPTDKTQDSSNSTWSVRCTRLVVEISLGGVSYFYPVTIPAMKQNTEYKVNLVVTRPGSTDADIPFEKDAATVTVEVVDWKKTTAITEKI